ncbi:MAG: class GN sortase [Vicinamibacteria bacterium]
MSKLEIRTVALLLTLIGLGQAAQAGYIHAKAVLAQVLIRRAWVKAENEGGSPKPWPWADTTPVARLGAPSHRVDLMVLEGGTGRTLAFGPGHVSGTAMPGQHGNVAIGGHRDTHFQFLKELKHGDRLLMESAKGDLFEYAVSAAEIVDRERADVLRDFGDDRLTLITCYPFDAVQSGGRLRYVVTAKRCDGVGHVEPCRHTAM